MITPEIKSKIIEAIVERRKQFESDAKMSAWLGIDAARYSQIMKGKIDGKLSDGNWMGMARRLELELMDTMKWAVVETETYRFINTQLEAMQALSVSGIFCDMTDIGKTFAAKSYVKQHTNAVYIDCSHSKTKQKLIRNISKEFGLGDIGKYDEIYGNLIFYLRSLPNPLIVLDEAGDLEYSAFLELKALWNDTENFCGWYMMGADGLRAKMERMIAGKKVGYAEIFRRYGSGYKTIVPVGSKESQKFRDIQVDAVAQVNGIVDKEKLHDFKIKCMGSLTRAYIEIKKMRMRG